VPAAVTRSPTPPADYKAALRTALLDPNDTTGSSCRKRAPRAAQQMTGLHACSRQRTPLRHCCSIVIAITSEWRTVADPRLPAAFVAGTHAERRARSL
jgi:hypothetical protein